MNKRSSGPSSPSSPVSLKGSKPNSPTAVSAVAAATMNNISSPNAARRKLKEKGSESNLNSQSQTVTIVSPTAGAGAGKMKMDKKAKSKRRTMNDTKEIGNLQREDSSVKFDHLDDQPIEVKRIPADQIKNLTPEQKNEIFTKVITATNPNVSKAITRFHYKDGTFKPDPVLDQMAVHFSMESTLIHIDSEEAAKQNASSANEHKLEIPSLPNILNVAHIGTDTKEDSENAQDSDENGGRTLKNQFNFSERACQTFNNPHRDRSVATEPPPTQDFGGMATQYEIFDTYLADLMKTMAAKNTKEPKAKQTKEEKQDSSLYSQEVNESPADKIMKNPAFGRALKIMERTVNQIAEEETYHDYKYYEEEADNMREDAKGDCYPLWRFQHPQVKRKTITSICWNSEFIDLFAVSYGSYDFTKQGPGMICCFSLKNTSYPEYTFTTESGVMCLDFHPRFSSLLCAGMYDGTVCVFDVRSKTNAPIYVSKDPNVKHTDPVWQVRWQASDPAATEKDIGFYSISSDGRVTNWTLNKNELVNEELMQLKLIKRDHDDDKEDAALGGLAGGSCFDFNTRNEHLLVVGTEEGSIQSYSKAYRSQYLHSYEGHHMFVYAVKWNPFHPSIFLSCSADWTVKLWHVNKSKPIMTFDLSSSVGDIAWAPYSSTVFATVTADGKLRVYDLNCNKHEPLGDTKVIKKAKLTHVAFNPKEPVVLVGDDSGVVMSLKLSPNLRKMSALRLQDISVEAEVAKLEKLLLLDDKEFDRSGSNLSFKPGENLM